MSDTVCQKKSKEIVIIGVGLGGMMMALYLEMLGYSVVMYEKAESSSLHAIPSIRENMLDISKRGLTAFSEIGLLNELLKKTFPTQNRVLSFSNGSTITIPHGPDSSDVIYSVARADLYNILFLAICNKPAIKVNFGYKLVTIDCNNKFSVFEKNNQLIKIKYSALLGCDGINSIVRQVINQDNSSNHIHSYLYKHIVLPPSFSDQYLDLNNSYKLISPQASLFLHPKTNQQFSCTLVTPSTATHTYSDIFTEENFPLISPLINSLYNEFINQPFNKLKSNSTKIQFTDNILLLGDAAHSMLPFLGQGINCAFEDCRLLNMHLKLKNLDWEAAIQSFSESRQEDTKAITEMSDVECYEFQPGYNLDKYYLIELLKIQLAQRYPDLFRPYRYLLAFTNLPYRQIKQAHELQHFILNKLSELFNTASNLDWKVVDDILNNIGPEYDFYKASIYCQAS